MAGRASNSPYAAAWRRTMSGLPWKGAGFDETLGGLLHHHDVFGRVAATALSGGVVPVSRERRVPIDGVAAVQRGPDPLAPRCGYRSGAEWAIAIVETAVDTAIVPMMQAGREGGLPRPRRRAAKAVDEIEGKHREQAAHDSHVSFDARLGNGFMGDSSWMKYQSTAKTSTRRMAGGLTSSRPRPSVRRRGLRLLAPAPAPARGSWSDERRNTNTSRARR